ncbi:hypothetical protein JOM56_014279 [Amanita muscaria]
MARSAVLEAVRLTRGRFKCGDSREWPVWRRTVMRAGSMSFQQEIYRYYRMDSSSHDPFYNKGTDYRVVLHLSLGLGVITQAFIRYGWKRRAMAMHAYSISKACKVSKVEVLKVFKVAKVSLIEVKGAEAFATMKERVTCINKQAGIL